MPIHNQGWLLKKGKINHSKKKRYCVLMSAESKAEFLYYEDETRLKLKGSIDLEFAREYRAVKNDATKFEIICQDRTWKFQCLQPQDRIDWINSLDKVFNWKKKHKQSTLFQNSPNISAFVEQEKAQEQLIKEDLEEVKRKPTTQEETLSGYVPVNRVVFKEEQVRLSLTSVVSDHTSDASDEIVFTPEVVTKKPKPKAQTPKRKADPTIMDPEPNSILTPPDISMKDLTSTLKNIIGQKKSNDSPASSSAFVATGMPMTIQPEEPKQAETLQEDMKTPNKVSAEKSVKLEASAANTDGKPGVKTIGKKSVENTDVGETRTSEKVLEAPEKQKPEDSPLIKEDLTKPDDFPSPAASDTGAIERNFSLVSEDTPDIISQFHVGMRIYVVDVAGYHNHMCLLLEHFPKFAKWRVQLHDAILSVHESNLSMERVKRVTTPSEFGTPTLVTAGTDLSLQTVDINQNAESYEEVNIETFDGDGKVKPTGCCVVS